MNKLGEKTKINFEINKTYNTIVIDPPWPITMGAALKSRPKRPNKLPYKTMSIEEIKMIPIDTIANPGAHVYCWTTNKFLYEAFNVLKDWLVNFHLVMPMVKSSGICPSFGYIFGSEFCLLGFYRKPMQKFLSAGKLNWFSSTAAPGKHSTKPNEFYERVKLMSPEPRIDVFARRHHDGFDAFGDELEYV